MTGLDVSSGSWDETSGAMDPMGEGAGDDVSEGGTHTLRSGRIVSADGQVCVGRFSFEHSVELILPRAVNRLAVIAVESGAVTIRQSGTVVLEALTSTAMVVDCRNSTSFCVGATGTFYVTELDFQSLDQRLADLTGGPLRRGVEFGDHVCLAASSSNALLSMMEAFFRFGKETARGQFFEHTLESMRRAIVDICISAFASRYLEERSRELGGSVYPRHVRRAIEFMRQNAARAIRMDEVAAAASTSKRTLELAFQRFVRVTPSVYLRELRLEGARRDLLDSNKEPSVSKIASQWGFSHLGLFSRYYRRAFGELPSTTLDRRA